MAKLGDAFRPRQANCPPADAGVKVVPPVNGNLALRRAAVNVSGRTAKIHFIDFVVRSRQADPLISLFGPAIAGLNVEPQPADLSALGRQPAHVRVERLKDALRSPALRHIDALDPPGRTIARVA